MKEKRRKREETRMKVRDRERRKGKRRREERREKRREREEEELGIGGGRKRDKEKRRGPDSGVFQKGPNPSPQHPLAGPGLWQRTTATIQVTHIPSIVLTLIDVPYSPSSISEAGAQEAPLTTSSITLKTFPQEQARPQCTHCVQTGVQGPRIHFTEAF